MDRPDAALRAGRLTWRTLARASLANRIAGWPRVGRHVVAAAFCLATCSLRAADDNKIIFPSGNTAVPAPAAGGGAVSTMTLVLALMLAAAGAWMVWRNRRRPGVVREGRNLAVEETRSLGNRQYLVVASYEGRRFLLGVCPGRIDMLAPLNDRGSGGGTS